jgi:hypothetical protein
MFFVENLEKVDYFFRSEMLIAVNDEINIKSIEKIVGKFSL